MKYALIFAGGVGARMHTKATPKQFLEVYGKSIIAYTVAHFQNHKSIDKIIIVCVETHIDLMWKIVRQHDFDKVLDVVPGGASGQESIWNGLSCLEQIAQDGDIVLIHDGVRPIIDERLITQNINSVIEFGSAISASSAIETFCLTGEQGTLDKVLRRSECVIAKAPQSFWLKDILECHHKAQEEGFYDAIDSASLMMRYGHVLHYVNCHNANIKITTPHDYYIFKGLLDAEESMQIIGL